MNRHGAVFLIVVGMCSLLLSLSVAFLVGMRRDGEEGRYFAQELQARAMLLAALQYIQEGSRIGWDGNPSDNRGEEAFGWTDARGIVDGAYTNVGPRGLDGRLLFSRDSGTFPDLGGTARCPMHRLRRPACAIDPKLIANPLIDQATFPVTCNPEWDESKYMGFWDQRISYANPDPQPLAEPDASDPYSQARFERWRVGDATPVATTVGHSWFRVRRVRDQAECDGHRQIDNTASAVHWSPGVFLISAGAGATRGYATYQEAFGAGEGALFSNSAAVFDDLRAQERILWYLCEWTPAQGPGSGPKQMVGAGCMIRSGTNSPIDQRDTPLHHGGNFAWIERLANQPGIW